MKDFKGTKGKWKYHNHNSNKHWVVCDMEGVSIMIQALSSVSSPYHAEANAKLIASAPELLEALRASKAVFEALGIYSNHRIAGEEYDKVVKAIKKATE